MNHFDLDHLVSRAHQWAAKQGLKAGPSQRGFTALFGPVFTRQTDCYLIVDERHINPEGYVHGGLLSAFADYVFYISAIDRLPEGTVSPTVDLQVQYMGVGKTGDTLKGTTEVLRETRDLLFMRGDIYAGETLIVAASGVYKKIRHQP